MIMREYVLPGARRTAARAREVRRGRAARRRPRRQSATAGRQPRERSACSLKRPGAAQAAEARGGYAAVVLATPLERSGGLRLTGVGAPPRPRRFQRTVTTFVRGRLAPAWFGVARLPGARPPVRRAHPVLAPACPARLSAHATTCHFAARPAGCAADRKRPARLRGPLPAPSPSRLPPPPPTADSPGI